MSLTLILNAAAGRLHYVFCEEEALLCAGEWASPRDGTERLAPLLAQTLTTLDRHPRDIARLACVVGPGSFTGIRLVLSTAAALRRASGAPIAPLNLLQALAATVPCPPQTRLRVLTPGRRDQAHQQDFRVSATGFPEPLGQAPPRLLSLDDALAPPSELDGTSWLLLGGPLPVLPSWAPWLPVEAPSTAALLRLAAQADYVAEDPCPLYVRPCDAVDNLNAIAAGRGQDPDDAHATLERLLQTRPDDQS